MSGIFEFVKKLLPRIERSCVEEDLRVTEKELSTITIGAYQAATDFFQLNKPESKQFKELQSQFYQHVNTPRALRGTNFVWDINNRLKALHENVLVLQSEVDGSLEKDIFAAGLSMRAAFLLRAAANISHISRYLLSLLNYIYRVESALAGPISDNLDISKAEMKYVEANFARFSMLLNQYSIEKKRFADMIKELPSVYINEKTRAVVNSSIDMDQISKGLVSGFVGSPIYAIRLQIANWQNDRYEAAKSKKNQLELRLLYLKNKSETDHDDPVLEREIGRLQDRIEKLDRKIHDTESEILGE